MLPIARPRPSGRSVPPGTTRTQKGLEIFAGATGGAIEIARNARRPSVSCAEHVDSLLEPLYLSSIRVITLFRRTP
ncbi:hypothetical protein CKO23_17550 [Thiocystis violacea]|nr:hypothetical protein [Thiocystis violacea]